MALQGTKALETWCRLVTEGYTNVNVVNMTTSWRNGLAFCAIIHKFRPELITFDQLDPEDAYNNNELAFTVAEQHLGIPALLDPQDMVECELLDRLSILTYLSQFYQTFHGATGPSKDTTPTKLRYITGSSCSSGSSTPSKSSSSRCTNLSMLPGKRSEPCKVCNKPVFILERLNVSGRLLHRTCFKCARCHHQLSIANYYETETGSYCCDMCPDEEVIQTEVAKANKKAVEAHIESCEEENDDDDEVNSLPECLQESNNNKEAVTLTVDQENNSVQPPEGDQEDSDEKDVIEADQEEILEEDIDDQDNDKATTEQVPECDQLIDKEEDQQINKEEDVGEDAAAASEDAEDTQEASEDAKEPEDAIVPAQRADAKNDVIATTEKQCIPTPSEEEDEGKPTEDVQNDQDNHQHTDIKAVPESVQDHESYPDDLNPFDDDEQQTIESVPENSPKALSSNPFGSDNDNGSAEEEDIEAAAEGAVVVKELTAPALTAPPPKPPRTSLNPFGSDFEDSDNNDEEKEQVKVPKRKKRHAPQPPGPPSASTSTPTPAPRVSLRPPRPPPPTSTYGKSQKDQANLNRRSQILEAATSEIPEAASAAITLTPLSPDKSNMEGKWKKKKGPAPPRPLPPKRQVKKLPRKAVNTELFDIEVKQQELERQGVELEKSIREVCEISDKERSEAGLDNNDRDSLGPEAEDLIVQLFELVNEKNELFRRQTELMYMKREHRLEEEHADIEHQIRVLMAKPDALRTPEDKDVEDKLIERLMVTVSQRNEIVDCLEMDRLRELEEDESIEIHFGEYAAIKPDDDDNTMLKKKKEKKKKEKKKKKKDKAYDADKDIDTSEMPAAAASGASLNSSPRPSPKKSPLSSVLSDKEKAKKLKKKFLSTLKPISMKR